MRTRKLKILNGLLILTSLVGYLEWGKGNHQFLAEAEFEVVSKLIADPLSVWHPFTLLPMVGQILLLLTLFQSTPSRMISTVGIACLGVLLVFMFAIGLLGLHFKIVASTLPFLTLAALAIRGHWKSF
ncbi:MAG: hypothetical protein HYZ44_01655 [Bacteroidetes bacterium]|nr:hypothetical protein [Bacteroidota bacterium]